MEYIKRKTSAISTNNQTFAENSVLMVHGEKEGCKLVTPINARDNNGLPYQPYKGSYMIKEFGKEGQDWEKSSPVKGVSIATKFPTDQIQEDPLVIMALEDIYSEKPYTLDGDGLVHKTSSLEKVAEGNKLTDTDDKITTDFNANVGGKDDPGYTDNYKEDTSEKNATAPILGPLAKKMNDIRKFCEVQDNNLTPSKENISTDFNTSINGSGTIDKGTYKEDVSEKPWKDENLGITSANKK